MKCKQVVKLLKKPETSSPTKKKDGRNLSCNQRTQEDVCEKSFFHQNKKFTTLLIDLNLSKCILKS